MLQADVFAVKTARICMTCCYTMHAWNGQKQFVHQCQQNGQFFTGQRCNWEGYLNFLPKPYKSSWLWLLHQMEALLAPL